MKIAKAAPRKGNIEDRRANVAERFLYFSPENIEYDSTADRALTIAERLERQKSKTQMPQDVDRNSGVSAKPKPVTRPIPTEAELRRQIDEWLYGK